MRVGSTGQTELAIEVADVLPAEFAETVQVIYLPQVGYLFKIPTKPGMDDPLEHFGVEGWDWVFTDDEHTYFKTEQCKEIDDNVGDLHSIIIDREVEISKPNRATFAPPSATD